MINQVYTGVLKFDRHDTLQIMMYLPLNGISDTEITLRVSE